MRLPRGLRIGDRSSMPQRGSRLGKRLFRVTALATLVPEPGGRDLGGAVSRLLLQSRNRGRFRRFAHDGVTGRTFFHRVTFPTSRTRNRPESWPPLIALTLTEDLQSGSCNRTKVVVYYSYCE